MEIVRTTVKEQIYNYLKEQILSQQITPGERINISAVAKELKVSNTPIREALLILEKDGLISNDPRTGPAVIDITPDLFQTIEKAVEILMFEDKADKQALMDKVAKKCTEMTRTNMKEAMEKGITPTENAYDSVESRIFPED